MSLLCSSTGAVRRLMVDFFGRVHRYTARGSPAIRAGKGWRGRRELAPRRSATRIRCMHPHAPGQTRRVVNHSYHHHHPPSPSSPPSPPHTHQPPPKPFLSNRLPFLSTFFFGNSFRLSAMDVDSVAGGGRGSARRRRERRLRQFLRHERLSVAMALSEKKHYTSRGQRKDRARSTTRPRSGSASPPGFPATLSG